MAEITTKKRLRFDSDDNSSETKRLRDELPNNLDDSDLFTTNSDLDSFMRSFEKEISDSPATVTIDLTSDSDEIAGELKHDLGFLLEASDDELGIPPPSEDRVGQLSELWRFEDELTSYDSYEYGDGYIYNDMGDGYVYNDIGDEYVYNDAESGFDLDLYEEPLPLPLWRTETIGFN